MARILIVEDEKELATIMVSYLKVEGFDAVAAFDGQKGKELFENQNQTAGCFNGREERGLAAAGTAGNAQNHTSSSASTMWNAAAFFKRFWTA